MDVTDRRAMPGTVARTTDTSPTAGDSGTGGTRCTRDEYPGNEDITGAGPTLRVPPDSAVGIRTGRRMLPHDTTVRGEVILGITAGKSRMTRAGTSRPADQGNTTAVLNRSASMVAVIARRGTLRKWLPAIVDTTLPRAAWHGDRHTACRTGGDIISARTITIVGIKTRQPSQGTQPRARMQRPTKWTTARRRPRATRSPAPLVREMPSQNVIPEGTPLAAAGLRARIAVTANRCGPL